LLVFFGSVNLRDHGSDGFVESVVLDATFVIADEYRGPFFASLIRFDTKNVCVIPPDLSGTTAACGLEDDEHQYTCRILRMGEMSERNTNAVLPSKNRTRCPRAPSRAITCA
jgi:hypothetical protein